jgi:hypothetical protein
MPVTRGAGFEFAAFKYESKRDRIVLHLVLLSATMRALVLWRRCMCTRNMELTPLSKVERPGSVSDRAIAVD